jgi:hypothetical protein
MGKKSEKRAARVAAAIARRKAAGTNPLEFTFTKDGPETFNISGEFRFHYTVQKSDLSYACQDAYGQVDVQLELDNQISSDENKARVDAAMNQLICEQGEAKIKRLNAEHPGWVLMSLKLFDPTNENGEWIGACHFVGEEHELDCGCTEPVKHSDWRLDLPVISTSAPTAVIRANADRSASDIMIEIIPVNEGRRDVRIFSANGEVNVLIEDVSDERLEEAVRMVWEFQGCPDNVTHMVRQ